LAGILGKLLYHLNTESDELRMAAKKSF